MGSRDPEGKVCSDAESSSKQSLQDYEMNYINLVIKTFNYQPETYKEFFRLMADFRNYRISADCLIVKVHLLFKEHKELLKGFNQFVPSKYKCCNNFNFEDAIAFVRKIKDRNMSESFLQVLYKCRTGTHNFEDTILEVCKLFKSRPDLLMEYQNFLPPFISEQSQPTDIPVPPPVSMAVSGGSKKYLSKVKQRFQDQPGKFEGFIKILKDFKNSRIDKCMTVAKVWDFLKGNHDLIMGFNEFLPEHCKTKVLVEYYRATDIINSIKRRLRYNLWRIEPFTKILDRYNMDTVTFDDFYMEVMEVLKKHPTVLDELRIPILMAYLSVAPTRRHLSLKDSIEYS